MLKGCSRRSSGLLAGRVAEGLLMISGAPAAERPRRHPAPPEWTSYRIERPVIANTVQSNPAGRVEGGA